MKKNIHALLPYFSAMLIGTAFFGSHAKATDVADNGTLLKYQVESGDSLVLILKHFRKFAYGEKGLLEAFRTQNSETLNARQNDRIFPGETLVLPFKSDKPSRHYFVKDGFAILGQQNKSEEDSDSTAASIVGAAGSVGSSKKRVVKSEEEALFPTIDDKALTQLPTQSAKSNSQPSTEELDRILQSVENK